MSCIPAFWSQRDPRWAGHLLGNSPYSTLAQYGCLQTCFAVLSTTMNPAQMNDCMLAHGGFDPARPGYALTYDIKACNPSCHLVAVSKPYADVAAPKPVIDKLIEHLRGGEPAIIQVDFSPKPKLQQHYVYAYGATDDGQNCEIWDPWPKVGEVQPGKLCTHYGANLGRAIVQTILYSFK